MTPLTDGAETTPRVIDPAGLTEAQRAGERCVVSNCCRRLLGRRVLVGQLPDGTPVFECGDHDSHGDPHEI